MEILIDGSTMKEEDMSNRLRSRRHEEDDWLLKDTNIKNRSLASISPAAEADDLKGDPEQAFGTSTSRRRQSGRDVHMLGDDDQILEIKSACFYKRSVFKDVLFALIGAVSGGLALIVCFSYPRVYARLRFMEVNQNDQEAERVLVESLDGTVTLTQIQWIFKNGGEGGWMPASKARWMSVELMGRKRMFVWREERFWYNDEDGSWTRRTFNVQLTYGELHTIAHDTAVQESHESDSRRKRYLVYGSNHLRVDLPNFGRLLITEVFKPFFIFQVFSVAVWMYQDYRIYAYVILSMTVAAVLFNVVQTRRNLQAVQKLAASECKVRRLMLTTTASETEFKAVLVSSSELLPGDLVEIEAGMLFPCDLVLLAGQCVCNESMLTGESALVPKTPLPSGPGAYGQVFETKSERDGRHMLLSGTRAVQIRSSADSRMLHTSDLDSSNEHPSIWQFLGSRPSQVDHSPIKEDTTKVAAMVITTGYGTAKGQLVRAIRFPKPSKYNFEKKLYYFMANSGIYLIFVCAVTLYFQVGKESASAIFLRCINLVTIAVPAALPLALSIGISVSFKRLQGNGVSCINPSRIVGAGRVDTLCFDKTGTITEDGLNLTGVVPVMECETQSCYKSMSCGQLEKDPHAVFLRGQKALLSSPERNSVDRISVSSLGLFYTLAACHSVCVLDYSKTGSGVVKEDGIRNQTGLENPGEGWKSMRFQRFRKMCQVFIYNHCNLKHSETSSEQERGDEQKRCHFIGDPLEIQMFTSTGWRYVTYPFDEIFGVVQRPNLSTIDVLRAVDGVIIAPSEGDSNPLLAIVRRFDFDSEIRLMSSIVLELPARDSSIDSARIWMLVKGAPESLQEICVPESLPHNFTCQLQDLTHKGYRVLACAYRLLQSMTVPQMMAARRQEMEKELIYCGFLVMENTLKPETSGVLDQLGKAGLREVMVTGDNPYTAAAVARQSGPFFLNPSCRTYLLDRAASSSPERYKSGCVLKDIDSDEGTANEGIDVDGLLLPQVCPTNRARSRTIERSSEIGGDINLIVTGRAFAALTVQHDHLREQFMERAGANNFKVTECVTPLQMVLTQANIFSRMSPQHKMELMRSLQDLGYVVCMTGDGANDSGALKAADVGISISSKPVDSTDTMAAGPSIAAPFSTKLAHIGAVPMVLAEGRCALVSATVMFKYMYFYALIQATSVLVLYRLALELYDYQYLWADLALVFPLVFSMPATRPRKKLSRGRPEDNLLAPPILISVYGQSVLIMLFQVLAQVYLQQQSWYAKPNNVNSAIFTSKHNYNSTVSFLFASFQYASLAMTLSQSFGMFRNSAFTNIPLTATLTCDFVLSSIMLLKPTQFASDAFSLVDLPDDRFRFGLWTLAIGNSLLFILFERYAVKHKSTERDLSDAPPRGGDSPPRRYSSLYTVIQWLKGEGNFCRTEKRDYFKVRNISGPAWSGLS